MKKIVVFLMLGCLFGCSGKGPSDEKVVLDYKDYLEETSKGMVTASGLEVVDKNTLAEDRVEYVLHAKYIFDKERYFQKFNLKKLVIRSDYPTVYSPWADGVVTEFKVLYKLVEGGVWRVVKTEKSDFGVSKEKIYDEVKRVVTADIHHKAGGAQNIKINEFVFDSFVLNKSALTSYGVTTYEIHLKVSGQAAGELLKAKNMESRDTQGEIYLKAYVLYSDIYNANYVTKIKELFTSSEYMADLAVQTTLHK